MNKLIQHMEADGNTSARTANGAVSNASSLDNCVDFFATVGACRGKNDLAYNTFSKAYGQNALAATKILFYGRDVRGGQGERAVFRHILSKMTTFAPAVVLKNLALIPEYGRWDDVLVLLGTRLEDNALNLFAEQLRNDWDSDTPSLCAKWAPSVNTSSATSRAAGHKIAQAMGLSDRNYRKGLSRLRSALSVIETHMSSGNWEGINYQHVPSNANLKYRNAFLRHDETRRRSYLEAVESGEAKMHASTLYPYDIVRDVLQGKSDATLEQAWASLPNFLEGNEHNGLVMADVSGSMIWGSSDVRPIDVSVSLALYIAERNTGAFKDYFMTFSGQPQLVKVEGATLADRVRNISRSNWAMNTNFQAAFESILSTAVANELPQEEMPDVLYIISDMQFDRAGSGTNFDAVKVKFEAHDYVLPKLVFWNVNASGDQPVTIRDANTSLVSGCSPNLFKQILSASTPVDVMNLTIDSDRYAAVSV